MTRTQRHALALARQCATTTQRVDILRLLEEWNASIRNGKSGKCTEIRILRLLAPGRFGAAVRAVLGDDAIWLLQAESQCDPCEVAA